MSNRIYAQNMFILVALLKIAVFSLYCKNITDYWATNPPSPYGTPDVSLLFFYWLPAIELIALFFLRFPGRLSWFIGVFSELFQLYQLTLYMLGGHLYSNLYLVLLILLVIVKLFFLLIPETMRYYHIPFPSRTTSPATNPPLRTLMTRIFSNVPGE